MSTSLDNVHQVIEQTAVRSAVQPKLDAIEPGAPFAAEPESTLYVEVDIEQFAAQSMAQAAPAEAATTSSDPAVQALELAAVRAEVKRYTREAEDLQRAVRLRDSWLAKARDENTAAQDQIRTLTRQLSEAQSRVALLTENCAQKDGRIAALDAEVQRLHAQTRTAIPEELEFASMARVANVASELLLVPVDHDGDSIPLNRKVMTIGRTAENDICVPSTLVSRDHARLLVAPGNVTIFDIGSVNGCFVNDKRVKKQQLAEGDILRVADRCYRVMAKAS